MRTRKTFQKIFVILNAFIFLLGTLGTFWRIRIIDFYFGNSIAAGITIYTSVFSVLIYFILKIKKLADYKFSLKSIFMQFVLFYGLYPPATVVMVSIGI